MMSGRVPNPIVFKNKKIKTRRPEHSLTPRPLHPITSHFCFVEQILDAVMKLVPIGFLSILKMQYIIFSCDFKTQLSNMFFISSNRYSATLKGSVF